MNRGSAAPQCWTSTLTSSRFNEAPIHESGKCDSRTCEQTPQAEASMRPRFMNRGSHAMLAQVICENPGFNEAPIHESGKFR